MPELIKNTTKNEIWYKFDTSFEAPKIYSSILLASPFSSENSTNFAKTLLLSNYFQKICEENLYEAFSANYELNVKPSLEGIEISLYGFSHKFLIVQEKIIQLFRTSWGNFSENSFNSLKWY